MEEKVLVKSERYNTKAMMICIILFGVVLSLLLFVLSITESFSSYNFRVSQPHTYYNPYSGTYSSYKPGSKYDSVLDYALNTDLVDEMFAPAIILVAFILIGVVCYFWFRNYELVVTDKRIYGKVAFGKQVDLPVDSLSAIGSIAVFKGVSVATASGKLSFLYLKNAQQIRDELSKLIIQRQNDKDKSVPTQTTINQVSDADELKKYKQLLDNGIITQEEFDAKKKQILGL